MTATPGSVKGRGDDRLLEVGRVVKPHGLRGEVVVSLVSNRSERTVAGCEFRIAGTERSLVVKAARPHKRRWLMQFEGVTDRDGAERLRGVVLLARPIDDPEADWVHEMIGAHVVTRDGSSVGAVVAVQANPASDLLVLESGTLIPLTFVVQIAGDRIVVDTPPGLLDL
ncbi:MAG: ribosome maturation factor RimM [Acidimicrobiales bacterium]|nr:MAG: ribosome maturation factor RimM [Acidimicrobiales bacterium]